MLTPSAYTWPILRIQATSHEGQAGRSDSHIRLLGRWRSNSCIPGFVTVSRYSRFKTTCHPAKGQVATLPLWKTCIPYQICAIAVIILRGSDVILNMQRLAIYHHNLYKHKTITILPTVRWLAANAEIYIQLAKSV